MTPEYVDRVERAFLRRCGRGIMLSPRDLELVARWERSGTPVDVVLEAIERAFDRRPAGARPVRSLAFVASAVEQAMREWQARRVGGRGPGTAASTSLGEAFDRLLARIEQAGRAQSHPALRDACRAAWRAVHELAERTLAGDEADPAAALLRLDETLADRALAALDAETRGRLEAEVSRALAPERSLSDPAALREAWRARLHRAVREAVGLPELTLDLGGDEW